MKKYLLSLLLILAYSPFLLQAQTTQAENNQSLTISSKITENEYALRTIKTILDNNQITGIETLLKQMPVTAEDITSKTTLLQSQKITIRQVKETETLAEAISKKMMQLTEQQQNLTAGRKQLQNIHQTIIGLEQLLKNPISQASISEQDKEKVNAFTQSIKQLEQEFSQRNEHLQQTLKQLQSSHQLLEQWYGSLSQYLDSSALEKNQAQTITELNKQMKTYQNKVDSVQERLFAEKSSLSLAEIEKLQYDIYENKTLAWLTKLDIELIQAIGQPFIIQKPELGNLSALSLPQLEQSAQVTEQVFTQLNDLQERLKAKQEEFKQYKELVGESKYLPAGFIQRQKAISYQKLQLKKRPKQLNHLITDKKQKQLFTRDGLYVDNHLAISIRNIGDSLVQVVYQIKISFQTLWRQILLYPYKILGLILLALGFAFIVVKLFSYLVATQKDEGMGMVDTLKKIAHVVRNQAYWVTFCLLITASVRVSEIPYPSDGIIRLIAYTFLALLLWVEIGTLSNKTNFFIHQFFRLRSIIATILAISVLLYGVAYMSSVEKSIVELYEKLLMLALAVFVWEYKKDLDNSLLREKEKPANKVYQLYLRALGMLPWLVIVTCLLSLLGFGKLAWLILSYIGFIILYLVGVTVGFVVINYLRKKLKLYSIKKFEHGAFVAQDIVSPLSMIAKMVWFLLATTVLFGVVGWDSNSYLIALLLYILGYVLFSFGKTAITPMTIILFILAIYFIFRLAKWFRTFGYHWLYSRVGDLGVRSSLSIFSQYLVVLAGVLITLNILGIDLTSLAVFAGALGVGIGLGLQDIAKNFISGILLLIERPLRSGDWVAIDGSEGIIKSIGMRAITMETFDKQEVIIPNGHAINNSFTNYTHSNSVTRTVLYIGAGYDSVPEKVIQTLSDAIGQTEGVLKDPEHKVVMWEYADSSINYRIQYYINVDNTHKWTVKTAVLKAIWHAFKAEGIEIPFPQRDIHFRDLLTTKTIE